MQTNTCHKCTSPASIEKRLDGYCEYIDTEGSKIYANYRGKDNVTIHLCFDCAVSEIRGDVKCK